MEEILSKLRFYLSLVVPICYVIIGGYVIKEKFFIAKLEPQFAYPLGGVLILYGLFRFYRAYIALKKDV